MPLLVRKLKHKYVLWLSIKSSYILAIIQVQNWEWFCYLLIILPLIDSIMPKFSHRNQNKYLNHTRYIMYHIFPRQGVLRNYNQGGSKHTGGVRGIKIYHVIIFYLIFWLIIPLLDNNSPLASYGTGVKTGYFRRNILHYKLEEENLLRHWW